MTDKEIFEKYCEKNGMQINLYDMLYKPQIQGLLSYKLFKLQIAIQELKQSIKDAIFGRKG